ncbi:unnamed protein product [Knipowitschia caucasica]|uniref:C-type lectin domain-containing protein n=1 Tax=Knipowitschia caucasica TaxID=637954 RepID=A0AAV2MCC7_KNICA
MELEKISKEPKRPDPTGEGTSGAQGKTKDEEEGDIYSSLQSPSEDQYVDTRRLSRPSKTKSGLWRKACFVLGAMCVILILIIVILIIKQKNEACEVEAPILAPAAICSRCPCPEGWVKSGQRCFLFSTGRKSWAESQDFCEQEGGSLAVITDATEQNFLMQEATLPYWIGLSLKNQVWAWVDGQKLRTNSFWLDSGVEAGDCAVLNGKSPNAKSWSKKDCTHQIYYICQKPSFLNSA